MGELFFSFYYGGLMLILGLCMHRKLKSDFERYSKMQKKN